jgi:hypothetical protein
MYRRSVSNYDVKIAVNYGVSEDDRVVLLDTGGLRNRPSDPIVSWHVPVPSGVRRVDYEREIGLAPMRELWGTGLENIARSTFVNPELEAPLRQILQSALQPSTQRLGKPAAASVTDHPENHQERSSS